MDHYDLLAHPQWTAETVLVVSPYVERDFFRRIAGELQPTNLTVVIDDGCRRQDVSMVEKAVGEANMGTNVRVVLGSAPGLVHAKVFHVVWRTESGRRAHTLVYGSGNATRQAFDGATNSEVMCSVRLTAARHGPILTWSESVRAAADESDDGGHQWVDPVRDAQLADGVRIRLPGMTVKSSDSKAASFDLWLQRGRLIPVFRPDPGFLRVHVYLLKDIPRTELEQAIEGMGFDRQRGRRLSFPYLDGVAPAPDGEGEGERSQEKWRGKFCVWTQLGDWCSDSCHEEKGHLFKRSGDDLRAENLERLKAFARGKARTAARDEFLEVLRELRGTLGRGFLRTNGRGLDEAFYGKAFDKRVERDLALSEDPEFRKRYVNGCEVIDVPRFRTDHAAWRSFVESFAEQIHLESLKARPVSLVYQRMRELIPDPETFDDPSDLVDALRCGWGTRSRAGRGGRGTFGDSMEGYHEG